MASGKWYIRAGLAITLAYSMPTQSGDFFCGCTCKIGTVTPVAPISQSAAPTPTHQQMNEPVVIVVTPAVEQPAQPEPSVSTLPGYVSHTSEPEA